MLRCMEEYKVIDGIGYIPEGVTWIENDAFRDCEDLREIVIPSTVTEIGFSPVYYLVSDTLAFLLGGRFRHPLIEPEIKLAFIVHT